jgi:hypothetical protein
MPYAYALCSMPYAHTLAYIYACLCTMSFLMLYANYVRTLHVATRFIDAFCAVQFSESFLHNLKLVFSQHPR